MDNPQILPRGVSERFFLQSALSKDRKTLCDEPTKTSPSSNMARQNPNIVITGTPGVGKTTHAEQLAQATGFTHISVNQIVKDEGFHEGKDEETGSWIVDEDKVCAVCSSQTSTIKPIAKKYPFPLNSSLTISKPSPYTPPAAISLTGTLATSSPNDGLILSSCCAATRRCCTTV